MLLSVIERFVNIVIIRCLRKLVIVKDIHSCTAF